MFFLSLAKTMNEETEDIPSTRLFNGDGSSKVVKLIILDEDRTDSRNETNRPSTVQIQETKSVERSLDRSSNCLTDQSIRPDFKMNIIQRSMNETKLNQRVSNRSTDESIDHCKSTNLESNENCINQTVKSNVESTVKVTVKSTTKSMEKSTSKSMAKSTTKPTTKSMAKSNFKKMPIDEQQPECDDFDAILEFIQNRRNYV